MRQSLLRSTVVVSAATLLSRILGFVRDVMLAVWFGAGPAMDAFLVAFKIPNFLRRLFAEGAFSQAFVPVLAQTRQEEGTEGVRSLVARSLGLLATVLAVLSIFAVAAAPWVIAVFAPGFAAEDGRAELAAELLRLTFPYLLFISLVALASAVLQTWERFAWPALAPVALNICLIGFGAWGVYAWERPIMALAWGVFSAGAAQLILVALPLHRMGLLAWPQWRPRDAKVRRILRLMAPIVFASSVAQLALLLDSILASILAVGSVSWLYYADRLMELPLGVFAIAISTVLLPGLARAHAQQNHALAARHLAWAVQWSALIVVPAAIALAVLAEVLVVGLFAYGEFSAVDAHMTSAALRAYALGLLGFSGVKVLFPAYSSRQDTRTPVRIGIIALSVGMLFNVVAVLWALRNQWEHAHVLLALGTSVAACLNATMLWRKLPAGLKASVHGAMIWRPLVAGAGMGVLLWASLPGSEFWWQTGLWTRVLWLSGLILVGLLSYAMLSLLLGLRLHHLRSREAL
nr:murein biosynthesis integral membrane protein MurJ [Oceanococcus sp. HetDA_MAG_MS8]